MSILKGAFLASGVVVWLALAVTLLPAALALGFWLLGIPLDWASWRTYAGFLTLSLAMAFLTK